MRPVEQYESYVTTYCDIIYSKVALKLGIYRAHVEALEREPYYMTRANPFMPLMVESIQVDWVMTVSKRARAVYGSVKFDSTSSLIG